MSQGEHDAFYGYLETALQDHAKIFYASIKKIPFLTYRFSIRICWDTHLVAKIWLFMVGYATGATFNRGKYCLVHTKVLVTNIETYLIFKREKIFWWAMRACTCHRHLVRRSYNVAYYINTKRNILRKYNLIITYQTYAFYSKISKKNVSTSWTDIIPSWKWK